MDSNNRFYSCESQGFPEVSNYDYDTNIPSRGIDDRVFRWEEVAVSSIYQFNEATSNGSLETTSFSSGLSNATGVNYITTGSNGYTGYSSWVVTGDRTVYIGTSGLFVGSGQLPSVTRSFQAHPIDGNEAIGLFKYGSTSPAIYTTPIATGSLNTIIPDGNHQLYLQAKLNYGSTGALKAYIRGYSFGTVVAYYNPWTYTWDLTAPTGAFTVGSGITTIKYDFLCSDYPAATPSSFDVYITNETSGTFITLDNIHIDAYFKKNAFIDYIVPSGYMIQITPDLGWHNIMAMFESTETNSNPHLKTLGPYVVDLGNLTDNLDNTVSATIDQNDLLECTTSNFVKYLWRAIPLTFNGNLGPGGYPQRFNYIGDIVNSLFTVDKVIQDDYSSIKVITGTKSKTMVVLVDDDETHPGISYPTPTTWRVEINLTSSTRTVVIKGRDQGGGTTFGKSITLTNKLYEQNQTSLWNVFDEHGLIADVERLPGESNHDYSLRIKDSYRNRGGTTFVGVVNGATRELNLTKISDAIKFSIDRNSYSVAKLPTATITTTSYSLRITTDACVKTERLFVDPVHSTIDLTDLPVDLPEFTVVENEEVLNSDHVEMVDCCDDTRYVYRIKIKNHIADGKFVEVKYKYYKEFLFKTYSTLELLINAINSISGLYVTATLSSLLSGNENSLGLYLGTIIVSPTTDQSIPWSPIFLKKMSDRGYRDYFITDQESTLKNTLYYSYVKELKNNTKVFWGAVEADRDRWDAADSKDLAMDSIPTLFDPPISKILSYINNQDVKIDPVAAWGRGYVGFNGEYLKNVGLSSDIFQPGVAHTNDLVPDVYITNSYININSSLEENIGPIKNDNNILIFSGQR